LQVTKIEIIRRYVVCHARPLMGPYVTKQIIVTTADIIVSIRDGKVCSVCNSGGRCGACW